MYISSVPWLTVKQSQLEVTAGDQHINHPKGDKIKARQRKGQRKGTGIFQGGQTAQFQCVMLVNVGTVELTSLIRDGNRLPNYCPQVLHYRLMQKLRVGRVIIDHRV